MMKNQRYLTKSRFKMAVECPTKLFYTRKPEYRDSMADNEFLQMLAEGGYQVGALAQLSFPEGIEVKGIDSDIALIETEKLLQRENVTLFEPAIRFGNFLIRIDVLVKTGNRFDLIEVKAKSYDSRDPKIEGKRGGGISSGMLPYLQDIAFQTWVLKQSFPRAEVNSYLMMPDKSNVSQVDGLNQMFEINHERDSVIVFPRIPSEVDAQKISKELLEKIPVNEYVHEILSHPIHFPGGEGYMADVAIEWSNAYVSDQKIPPAIGSQCGACQFKTSLGDEKKSGFFECWKQVTGLVKESIESGTVLDLWNFKRKQELINNKIYLIENVQRDCLGNFDDEISEDGLSRLQRQWLQVSDAKNRDVDDEFYFDKHLVSIEMASWKFPLHFIDFETSTVALPFYKGMRPYEPIAFQFSHHEMDENGAVAHVGECLLVTPGEFPNFEFARKLKAQLENDVGSVFMWSHHENTILTSIIKQLREATNAPADKDDLISFLQTLTKGGEREMIDLCKIAEKSFFHPDTNGSNSIKKVLPAVLKISKRLQDLYSGPSYGAPNGIVSKNFSSPQGFVWLDIDSGNPYSKLKALAKDLLPEGAPEDSVIAEGGAAATAYSRLQFEALNSEERKRIKAALLRYCELDTLAMVMVVQAWQEMCS